ncbi:DUF7344 domain-containing protein [Halopelagius longus]|uniref:DUF7344 domain-containing protein n=1 Tax=Halopelagius longus TaxID=1236180 RepID=A0A1H1ERA5_9EURY|nr:hypothetical protein [Halopelagius longus]RDI71853.1 hypothetical protein DWB78_09025 [Halopelagius longus]SDQ91130.1 hypothetical protein SAMN05216278_3022 [Halopelagius longus]
MVPSTCDTLHELLAARRRRDTLAAVVEANRPLTRREIARRVAARTEDGLRGPDDHPDREINELEVELRHRHLPPLLDADAVTRSESDRFAATTLGHDLYRAERAFRAVVGDSAEEPAVRGRASTNGVDERRSSGRRANSGNVAGGTPASSQASPDDVGERSSAGRATKVRGVADENGTDDELVLSVSWAAVEAIDYLVASDDRWSTHPGYDEAIRTAVLEASK